MSTQKNNSSQFKEVNQKIKTALHDLHNIIDSINVLKSMEKMKRKDLKVLLNERKEIKESNELIKKSKQWNQ